MSERLTYFSGFIPCYFSQQPQFKNNLGDENPNEVMDQSGQTERVVISVVVQKKNRVCWKDTLLAALQ